MIARLAVAVAAATLLAACTSSNSGRDRSPSAPGPTAVTTAPTSSPTTPVPTGPTTAAAAASCPYATKSFVRDTMGMRLGRITVLRSAGRTVGCRYYAVQGSFENEHLPGPHQPAVQITTQRYAGAIDAHNAVARLADKGTDAQRVQFGAGLLGVCFQTDFDPTDHGHDAACAVNKGALELVVRSVDTKGTFSTQTLTTTVVRSV